MSIRVLAQTGWWSPQTTERPGRFNAPRHPTMARNPPVVRTVTVVSPERPSHRAPRADARTARSARCYHPDATAWRSVPSLEQLDRSGWCALPGHPQESTFQPALAPSAPQPGQPRAVTLIYLIYTNLVGTDSTVQPGPNRRSSITQTHVQYCPTLYGTYI